MKYYLIAGEASGDLHASNLMHALAQMDTEAEFRFMGGGLMQDVGGTLVKHYREMAYMGFVPVLMNLRSIMRNMQMAKKDIKQFCPDVVILIDYPGFNLKIAKYLKTTLKLPVYYYISPKIWAWKKYRINSFRKYIDRMFCILPFETGFYRKLNYEVDYVGNPSVDSVHEYVTTHPENNEAFRKKEKLGDKPLLALLPGSRKQEIKDNLPTMLKVAARFPGYQPVVAGSPGIDPSYYRLFMKEDAGKILFDKTYPLLQHSGAAMVTSGTATLEAALFRVPQVVCYYTPAGRLVNFIFERFFHIPYISLVNLIAGREVVRELFGKYFSADAIHAELMRIIDNGAYKAEMIAGYDEVIRTLGEPGASRRAASLIYHSLHPEV